MTTTAATGLSQENIDKIRADVRKRVQRDFNGEHDNIIIEAEGVVQPFAVIAGRLADLERRLSELESEKKEHQEK